MWIKIPGLTTLEPGRDSVNALSEGALGKGGHTLSSSTVEIADKAVAALNAFLDLRKEEKSLNCYRNLYAGTPEPPFACMFAMTMDMEYAHIAGYDGQTIYHVDYEKKLYFYYKRESGVAEEFTGKKVLLNREEFKQFNKWRRQIIDSKTAALKHPWQLILLYHYDPRRWNYWNKEDVNANKRIHLSNATPLKTQPEPVNFANNDLTKATWNYPFGEIAGRTEKNRPGLCVGFKMYTTQGYMPLDEKCGCLALFYQKCMKEQIPIVTHCSPGGNTIPEMKYYKEYLFGKRNNSTTGVDTDATQVSIDNREGAEDYFLENYVHPRAWRKVLQKYPQLRLCLAHFGGDEWEKGRENSDWIKELIKVMSDYKNVYTDISCFDIGKNRKGFEEFLRNFSSYDYRDRILFGTDWYMIMLVLSSLDMTTASAAGGGLLSGGPVGGILTSLIWGKISERGLMKGKEYGTFCIEIKKLLDKIDFRLWIRFTILNPIKFYGLDNQTLLDNLKDGLEHELNTRVRSKKVPFSDTPQKYKNMIKEGYANLKNLKQQITKLEDIVNPM